MKVESYWSHTFLPELIRADGVIFDFGAFNGGFCKIVAPLCQKVVAFEPDPCWEQKLSLPENVIVRHQALAARRGVVRLNLNHEKCSSMHYFDSGSNSLEVDAITLADALTLAPEGRIELVKMDIEGEEVAVLRDAPPEILQRVVQLSVEFHDFIDPSSTPAILAVIKRMRNLGFLAIKFSWRSYGDFLFINQRRERLSLRQRLGLTVVHKYGRGFERIARRVWHYENGLAQ
jgi:FkbM family methyltransferase